MAGNIELERTLAIIKPDALQERVLLPTLFHPLFLNNEVKLEKGRRRNPANHQSIWLLSHCPATNTFIYRASRRFLRWTLRKSKFSLFALILHLRFKMFFTNLMSFMSGGPIIAIVLGKKNAIEDWRKLMGPTNPMDARERFPDSIRALFGKGTVTFFYFP